MSDTVMEELQHKAINRSLDHIGLSKEREGEWRGGFSFIQAADTQLGLIDDFNVDRMQSELRDDLVWDEELARIARLVDTVNRMDPSPRFLIVCGDQVHGYPWMKQRGAMERDFISAFRKLRPEVPLLCVCGNHDVGESPTPQTIAQYRRTFGDDYYSFWVGGVAMLLLNSQLFMDDSKASAERLGMDQWVDRVLAGIKGCKQALVFQHIPYYLGDIDSPRNSDKSKYFSLPMELRKPMLDKFKQAGVTAVFCGHYHRNAVSSWNGVEHIVTSAVSLQIGDDKPGYRLVTVTQTGINHQYCSLTN